MPRKKDYWRYHPQRKKGEIFLTNTDSHLYDLIEWKTKRADTDAYERFGDGERFGEYPETFPVFVKIEELKDNSLGKEILAKIKTGSYY